MTAAESPAPTPSAEVPRGAAALIAALTAGGFALTVAVVYPGYMTNDATFVYGYIKEWQFGDWQSPLMSILWWAIDPIAPGPGSMFLLVATLYWFGFGIVALTLARRSTWLGVVVLLLALMPPAFMLLGMIWRDILFAVVWLTAAALAFATAGRRAPLAALARIMALGFVCFGVLLRPNSIIAAPLLAVYAIWPQSFNAKRAAILFIPGIIAGYALIHVVYYGLIDAKREDPLHSLLVFDLGGITHFSGENQFPVSWTPEETALLTGGCYNPDRWDYYWTVGPCRFVMARLERPGEKIFGTAQMTQAWLRAVTTHPLAYLRHRATHFWTFLAGPTLTLELYRIDDRRHTLLADSRAFQAVLALHDALKQTPLFRLGVWLIIAVVVLAFAWPARGTTAGAFAVGATGSAIVYVMTFALAGVAGDFRYGYWCVLASLVGAPAAYAAMRNSTERGRDPRP